MIKGKRELTGLWALKKTIFGYKLLVETIQTNISPHDFDESPKFIKWEKATNNDIKYLEINIY